MLCWSECPHCLIFLSAPTKCKCKCFFFSKFILYHQVVLQTISFSKMQCNANIRWHCFFRQEVQGIDSEDKITTWSLSCYRMQVQIPVSASADPSRVPHCLSNSPSHSHQVQVQVQVLFFPSLYYNTKKCFKPICFSKMQCNAISGGMACFFRQVPRYR